MIRDDICVEEVHYGDGIAKVVGITIKTGEMKKRRIIVTMEKSTWYKGEEEPSLLDLVTKKLEPPPIIQYQSPIKRLS
ncbi:hypothetical protein E2C01_057001 [Portunus trituberculatus]|uniref:Uncharacterized protein n=1 Tax=Portunus trituberculatus TaxID=210409 RepID=A0A5B7GRV8_PORTR|nr:hypothetical protein [Portunus trituberculatus]